MHTTNLRKVGGSVMLAIPPAVLDMLQLQAGATVALVVDGGRLIVEPQPRRRYTLEELAGDNVMFAATGVTTGDYLRGVRFFSGGATTNSVVMRSKTRTIRFIEANLFLPISLAAIARHAGASTSTLLRSFRRATGLTPYAYVKSRRLDEAKQTGRLAVCNLDRLQDELRNPLLNLLFCANWIAG